MKRIGVTNDARGFVKIRTIRAIRGLSFQYDGYNLWAGEESYGLSSS